MKASHNPHIHTLISEPWSDYSLVDSGNGRKLERYGKVLVNRPEPQALWTPSLREEDWFKADAMFTNTGDEDGDSGKWKMEPGTPDFWPVQVGHGADAVTCICRLMSFRHMGLFPEQMPHWEWVGAKIKEKTKELGRPLNILNLFAYTGAASLAAARAGASVTHLDASKKANQWAKDNQEASGLGEASVRWICDDAKAFVAREARRGRTYDGIILDPPKFGRGPDGERWQFEEDIGPFLKDCVGLLSDNPSFVLLTAYAMRFSSVSLAALLTDSLGKRNGSIDYGELLIRQESGGRFLSTSLYARWAAS